MADLTLTGIVKDFGKTRVLHPMDIRIEDGEFIVIVGPSGCGKSTILRLIAGLEQVTDGQISISGTPVTGVEPKDRDIAMVFQNYALYPHMTVFDNMAYGLKLRKIAKEQIRQRVDEAARLLQLETLLERKPKALSGGQRQRVAMGRAIVRHPAVFLFDEPLSNLDAKLRATMRVELKKLHSTLKTTMIYVTHDQVEAMTLADRILVMNQGRIEQIGTPSELYLNPQNLFAARFIGSPEINLLLARVNNNTLCFQNPDLTVEMPNGVKEPCDCVCGIRPEHLKLSPFRSEPDIRFVARIDLVESLGADSLFYMDCGTKDPIVARTGRELDAVAGDKVEVGFFRDKILFFDPHTGHRLTARTAESGNH